MKVTHGLAVHRRRASEVVDLLFESPIVSGPQIAQRLGISGQGAKNLIGQLQEKGLVSDYGERLGRRRSWVAGEILEAVSR